MKEIKHVHYVVLSHGSSIIVNGGCNTMDRVGTLPTCSPKYYISDKEAIKECLQDFGIEYEVDYSEEKAVSNVIFKYERGNLTIHHYHYIELSDYDWEDILWRFGVHDKRILEYPNLYTDRLSFHDFTARYILSSPEVFSEPVILAACKNAMINYPEYFKQPLPPEPSKSEVQLTKIKDFMSKVKELIAEYKLEDIFQIKEDKE